MQISPINNQNRPTFGMDYRLSKEAIKAAGESTGLTNEQLTRLPLIESAKLIEEKNTPKNKNKLLLWLQDNIKFW